MNYYDFISKNSVNYINSKLKKFKLIITKNNVKFILNNPGKNHGRSVKSAEEAFKNKKLNSDKIKDKEFIIKYYNKNINKFFK
jgi:ABC-type sulfate transport system substrate-binding protein